MSYKWIDCNRCGRGMIHWPNDPVPTICDDCQKFDLWGGEDSKPHPKLVQCPDCKTFINIMADCDLYHLFEDGDHQVYCEKCDRDFWITTEVRYVFWSPQKKEKNDHDV